MKLKRLNVERLPGIHQPFRIEAPKSGVHVIFGPNAIGKSSICRAVEALYWDDRGPEERTSLTAEFEVEGETWRAEREGARLRWRCEDGDRARPELPASLHHRCFFLRLRDLVDPSPDGAQDVADEIRRQMSGGFDLRRIVQERFSGISGRHGRRQRAAYDAAVKDVREAEGNQAALRSREDALADLQQRLDDARRSGRRLTSVERALGLAGRGKEHGAVRERIASMPEALSRLAGDERKRIDELKKRVDAREKRIRDLEGERDAARDAARQAGLPAELNPSDLEIWRRNAEELMRIELELRNARTDRSKRREEVASALSAFGGGDVDETALTLEKDAWLFEFLRDASDHRENKIAVEERLRLLADIEPPEDDQIRLGELREAVGLLRRWLRASDAETSRPRPRERRIWIAVSLAVAALGAVLSVSVDPRFALLLAAGAGALAPILLLARANAAASERFRAEKEFARLAMEAPAEWQIGPVEALLRELEERASHRTRARDRDVERRSLESRLEPLAEKATSLDERRAGLVESLGLEALKPDAELVDFAHAVVQLRDARRRHEGATGRVDELETDRSRLLSGLTDVLERHGEASPEDAAAAKARLGALEARNAQLVTAVAAERGVSDQLDRACADREETVEEIGRIYATAALERDDAAGLAALLDALPGYRELQQTERELRGQIRLDREELEKAGEGALADRDEADLESLQHRLSATADGVDGLQKEVAEIEAQVKEARRGTGLQDLIARREDARAELMDCRDQASFAAAGRFLVDAVEKEHEGSQMPRVFERARDHFSAFTHHGYRLRVGHENGESRLFATDLKTREPRQLDELSDGTRAQLLLAARLAFAEEVEKRMNLPLFLDEALDQSDPQRFDAIARSLGRLAKDQERQIFYLTSDPADRDRIRAALRAEGCAAASEIDLASTRNRTVAVTEPSAFRVSARPGVPSPAGTTPEKYAAALGVPRFEPALGHHHQHFFHLLSDDLDLLHACLTKRIERVGQWDTVSGTALAHRLSELSGTTRQIGPRIGLLETFCESWNLGRGRAVDRDALARSGAVSDKFLDKVSAVLDDLDGDARRLVEELGARSDPRLSGFRRRNVEALREHLLDHGYLDERAILDEDELTLRALTSPPANELPDGVAGTFLHRWWELAATRPENG